MLSFPVVEKLDVLKSGSLDVGVSGVANAMHPLILEAVEPALRWRIDAPMSSTTLRIGQIVQDERVQFPDDIALQTAMDFFV